jgi:hypothetical protein
LELSAEVWKRLLKERLSGQNLCFPGLIEVLAAGSAPAAAHSVGFRNQV